MTAVELALAVLCAALALAVLCAAVRRAALADAVRAVEATCRCHPDYVRRGRLDPACGAHDAADAVRALGDA